jgi:hypothetical protein
VTEPTRAAAYRALIDALIALRRDPATARFDEYLTEATAAGLIDEQTARALRWWQRESIRGVEEHLEELLPTVLQQLEAADQAAVRAVEISEHAWRVATAPLAAPPHAEHPAEPHRPEPPAAVPQPPEPNSAELEPAEPQTGNSDSTDSSEPEDGAAVQRTLTAGLNVIPEEHP